MTRPLSCRDDRGVRRAVLEALHAPADWPGPRPARTPAPHKIEPRTWCSRLSRVSSSVTAKARSGEGWDGLWGLLTRITLRKCADRVRHYRASARHHREAGPPSGGRTVARAMSREPSPEEAVVLAETVEQVLGELDENERPIIELSLQVTRPGDQRDTRCAAGAPSGGCGSGCGASWNASPRRRGVTRGLAASIAVRERGSEMRRNHFDNSRTRTCSMARAGTLRGTDPGV